MDAGMGASGGSPSTPLNSSCVDFSNRTQAIDFLGQILDDSVFQVTGNQYARYFWYGVVVVIGIAGVFNIVETVTLKSRLVSNLQARKLFGVLTVETGPNRRQRTNLNLPYQRISSRGR
jgi:ferric-chelate reductase